MTVTPFKLLIKNALTGSTKTASPVAVTALDNMTDIRRSRVVRWTDIAAECVIDVTPAAPVTVDGFAVIGTNLSVGGYCGVRFYNAANEMFFDTGQTKTGGGLPPWGAGMVWGVDPLGVDVPDGLPATAYQFFTAVVAARMELYFYDPHNPDGYIQFGYALVGEAFTTAITFNKNYEVTELNGLSHEETDGGSLFAIDPPRIRREWNIPHKWLDATERSLLSGQRRLYPNNPVFAVLFPDGTSLQRKDFAMLSIMSETRFSEGMDSWSATFQFKEV